MEVENLDDKKARSESRKYGLYRLVNTRGGGILLPLVRHAISTGDDSMLTELINREVKPFMYHGGRGRLIPIYELVLIRNRERNALLSALYRKKGKGKQAPNVLEAVDQEANNRGNLRKVLKLLDGGRDEVRNESKYRDVVWRVSERGAMGETLIGVCLLQWSPQHNALVKKIITMFPKTVNDIWISEDYYGLSPLHQAIINGDTAMVYFLLQRGADVNARCYGAWFCPDDQKCSRIDSLEHESVELCLNTDYGGRMYFGEYPLSFAVCTNQVDSFRLLIAKGANPNLKDTNGNTALHLAVIHNKGVMLSLAYESGAKLQVLNQQRLTPLTLAARLAKKKMLEDILKLEANVMWVHRDVSITAYPLANIDTIDQHSGELNENSALSLIVYGETRDHLDLLDGLLEEILQAKWVEFGKKRFMRSFLAYLTFFCGVFVVFQCRSSIRFDEDDDVDGSANSTMNDNFTEFNATSRIRFDECQLWSYHLGGDRQTKHLMRLIAELYVLGATIYQVIDDAHDLRNIGRKWLWKVLKAFPAKVAYKCSFIFVLATLPIRLFCGIGTVALFLDDVFALMIVLCVAAHFLFFARAVKFLGPFILMIYTIVTRDISRFLLIYSIFVIGFSQGFYVVFHSCNRAKMLGNGTAPATSIKKSLHYTKGVSAYFDMSTPTEAAVRLFIMTLGEYTVFYRQINECADSLMRFMGKILFMLYQLLVSLLTINLLIAMLTRTFNEISRTQKEWKRQVQNLSEAEKRENEKRIQQLREQKQDLLRERLKRSSPSLTPSMTEEEKDSTGSDQ